MNDEKPKYKLKKVFDCQDMPEDIRDLFFELYDNVGNDCYLGLLVEKDPDLEPDESYNRLWNWLIEHGAFEDEHVLVKHWW